MKKLCLGLMDTIALLELNDVLRRINIDENRGKSWRSKTWKLLVRVTLKVKCRIFKNLDKLEEN
jgi:hypothetical protein